MNYVETGIGAVGVGLFLATAAGVVLPAPKPIVVHSLRYVDGIVYQDRTVTTPEDRFFAFWAAAVIDAETGAPLRHCAGDGAWPYKPGRITAEIEISEWVGSAECTADSIPPGSYRLVATWSWGNDSTSFEGPAFTIGD